MRNAIATIFTFLVGVVTGALLMRNYFRDNITALITSLEEDAKEREDYEEFFKNLEGDM